MFVTILNHSGWGYGFSNQQYKNFLRQSHWRKFEFTAVSYSPFWSPRLWRNSGLVSYHPVKIQGLIAEQWWRSRSCESRRPFVKTSRNSFPRLLWINLWRNRFFLNCLTVFLQKITICLKNRHKLKNKWIQLIRIFQALKLLISVENLKLCFKSATFLPYLCKTATDSLQLYPYFCHLCK